MSLSAPRWLRRPAATPSRHHRPPAGTPLLATEDLRVTVGGPGGRLLVDGLSLALHPGQFWCLLGPNGAGKTQLLHTLAGARPPASGAVEVGGHPLAHWPLAELACLRGYVPQAVHDAFSTPVLDVVLQGRHPHVSRWHWEGRADHALALQALARVGLAPLALRDVTTLSGGERQRVALATLLAQDPPLALLDEPLAHLDLAQQLRMLDLLKAEVDERQRAVLMSVHDLSLAARVATHALLITAGGRVVAGPVEQVMTAPQLSRAFGHPLRRHEAEGRTWWLPA
ncbi:ABC transporter ATP-binding protein [Ideonella livida]|uniref:ABC transporter ATP-binding protein n=1 Tax=Ideonella livida TaxID=2707176 RepID=A0A7C9TIG0_9BURK|nr:ABC transporter ATP-binding protein [Ideonella livida]NDY91299.1 ABC transporter ATP-binding protein [Ideonella livida]